MDSDVLTRRGFSLVELGVVLMAVSAILAVSFYSAGKIRQAAFAQRTLDELNAIAGASLEYYKERGAWPVSLSDLRPEYLVSGSSDVNPFGSAYTISSGVFGVSVSTLLPKGLITGKSFGSEVVVINQGNNDLVSVTRSIESRNWKLKYDKKYIYKQ